MDISVLVNEICWEYDYSRQKSREIVDLYLSCDKYEDLCNLVISKQEISMEIREDV